MLDYDLAAVYGVTTKALNQAVKRNLDRFPADFVFELTLDEKDELVTNCDRLATLKHSSSRCGLDGLHGDTSALTRVWLTTKLT